VCKPKEEGGLGLRRAAECNKATMMKVIWDILTNKHSLWVIWCNAEILKGRSIWHIEPKQALSVIWKRLLSLRALVSANLVYTIGRNSSWSIWYDPWFQNNPLFAMLGDIAIYDSRLQDTSLSEVLQDSTWNWPTHVCLCPFGCGQQETLDHLFFDCAYTKSVWSKVMELNNCPPLVCWKWDTMATWTLGHSFGSHFHRWMRRAGLSTAIYHYWRERNNRI
ncbi:LOW QUALITY PROTEIN: zf-RVT domain-containing protein, partial [Cephalotus follicularis]